MNAFSIIEEFNGFATEKFGDNNKAVILTGSYAKNDYTVKSDIDLWLVLETVDLKNLELIAEFTCHYKPGLLNIQCVAENELLLKPFKKVYNPVQLYVDGIIKSGKLPSYIPYNSEIRNFSTAIAAEVMMSSRHYISSGESEESLISGRLLKWILKPLSWVFRYKVFLNKAFYPRSFVELKDNLENSSEKEFIDFYEKVIKNVYSGPFKELNIYCHKLAIKNSHL